MSDSSDPMGNEEKEEGVEEPGPIGADDATPRADGSSVQPAAFSDIPDAGVTAEGQDNLSLILEIPVTCSVELGRSNMPIGELLKLARGSVVSLERPAGTPLDILVNGCLIAHGEVVVVNNKFAVRLLDIVDRRERLQSVS